ncbi:prepilin-type N-terminal cleavage/methylation domain-containing protein [Desulfonatronospira sp.]|uniref:PulJ/GspJ family protein n=1 Tax=Desulfonatronospira sp. TaxID=1962951 RepID=UPI0025C48202|nr:prepilin-type N-terminal cleavage/methylation domain-containing protein [Desulfonatronospira sp.]
MTIYHKSSGFTLLELVVAMTIVSLVVLTLYQAFSIGVRVWDSDDRQTEKAVRLEAALRLIQDDISRAVSYDINWSEGSTLLFAGGPDSIFYVTRNGTGAIGGAGSALFFSVLYLDSCQESDGRCLFIFKSPRPGKEFVEAVDSFRRGTEFEREHYQPGSYFAEKSVKVLDRIEDWNISYSPEEFQPFAGLELELPDQRLHERGRLADEDWVQDDLPGRVRIAFKHEDLEYEKHVPVGQHK